MVVLMERKVVARITMETKMAIISQIKILGLVLTLRITSIIKAKIIVIKITTKIQIIRKTTMMMNKFSVF